MMLPECAALGTLTSRPAAFARRCAPGDLRLMRAPGRAGNATVNPALSPLPVSSSVPCTETWCGFALHLVCGVQVTLVMRTEVTCALGLRAAEVPAPDLAEVAAAAEERRVDRDEVPDADVVHA